MNDKKSKYDRILSIYSSLTAGEVINKAALANEFGATERTIQRDIDDLRAFFADNTLGIGCGNDIVYDKMKKGFRLTNASDTVFTNSELLAVCKILLESRSLVKEEMMPIIHKLLIRCTPEKNKRAVMDLIGNEAFHYAEPHHGVAFVDLLWEIGTAIREQREIEIEYIKMKNKETVKRRIKPVGIMVSEFYFYLTAFIDDPEIEARIREEGTSAYPTIYRIDRIHNMKVLDERFFIPYAEKFDEGEFRKRVQFMYGGKLQTVRFTYSGESIEAVLDRLPTAVILDEKDGIYTVEAEVYGKGIDMWLRSQGEKVHTIS